MQFSLKGEVLIIYKKKPDCNQTSEVINSDCSISSVILDTHCPSCQGEPFLTFIALIIRSSYPPLNSSPLDERFPS